MRSRSYVHPLLSGRVALIHRNCGRQLLRSVRAPCSWNEWSAREKVSRTPGRNTADQQQQLYGHLALAIMNDELEHADVAVAHYQAAQDLLTEFSATCRQRHSIKWHWPTV